MKLLPLLFLALPTAVFAAPVQEILLEAALDRSATQSAVLSLSAGSSPKYLAVLLPGFPSVLRPKVDGGAWVAGRTMGNFLIRSRKLLVDDDVATLSVDCRSDSGDECRELYQSSEQRFTDARAVIELAKARFPSIQETWLIGTSMGTVSSAYMAKWGRNYFAGAIHTASMSDGFSTRSMASIDFSSAGTRQVLIHHRDDPCRVTPYEGAKYWSEKFGMPLLTVTGGSGFSGSACNAFTEHGFRGVEKEVMGAVSTLIKTGKLEQRSISPAQ